MITPTHVRFGPTGEADFRGFLKEQLQACKDGLKDIHETKLPEWRRVYNAQPFQAKRDFPFLNASNLVVPLAAIYCDTLQARVLSAVFKLRPIWTLHLAGDFQGEGDALRKVCEDYLTNIAVEPRELDLYRVYKDFTGDVIRYGTSVIKVPWESLVEASLIEDQLVDSLVYDGPKPEKIPFEDIFITPQTKTLDTSVFKAHRRRLGFYDLQFRRKLYDKAALERVLASPDRYGPTAPQKEQESKTGAITIQGETAREWDVFECWCIYEHNGHKVRLISTYHPKTEQILRTIYSFFPDDPWVGARLFMRDGMYYGEGLVEKLSNFQEEGSHQHNERRDAQTVANAKMMRVDPASALREGFDFYPGAKLPAGKDEVEAISYGEPSAGVGIAEEQHLLDLADRLSGVSPPQQGYGATQSKKGSYSAMGTLSMLQEGNTRTDMHISDIRDAHLRIGRLVSNQIAALGLEGSRFRSYGKDGEKLLAAFQNIKSKRLYMPVLASTAAINREVEKQSDILLVGMVMRHYGAISQMLAQVAAPMVPQEVKTYVMQAIKAANGLMENVLRHFDVPEPTRLVPEVGGPQGGNATPNEPIRPPQSQGGPPVAGPTGGPPVPGVGGAEAGGGLPAGQRTQ